MRAATGNFDDLADAYDRFRLGYADEVYEALFEYGATRGARALDVGCGTGLVTAELLRRGISAVGVDVSEPMLERARSRVRDAEFRIARAEVLPFDDASFDVVTSAQAFHWFDQPQALAELARVLRPGGVIAVWWKGLMRGDTMRHLREEIAFEIGCDPPPDLLTAGFDAFARSRFVDRRLRVIPWRVTIPVGNFIGYERSRARSRDAYGPKIETYMDVLVERLGRQPGDLALTYTHMLYLGRLPEAS